MGKQALTSHASGMKHLKKEKYRKSTASVAVLFSSRRQSDSSTVTSESGLEKEAPITSSTSTASVSSIVLPNDASISAMSGVENNRPTDRTYFVKDEVTKTEILMCLLAVHRHQSVRDVSTLVDLLPSLFPDSQIASKVKLQKTKVSYGIIYGLAPFFKEQLREILLQCDMFAVGFDESLNKVSQNQQMDLVVRFWHPDKNEVCTRYLASVFLDKAAATDILVAFQNGLTGFDLKKMVQVSMDGPNVNKAFYSHLSTTLTENCEPDDPKLINFGTCGLHTVHLAFKTGCKNTNWEIVSFLRALYNLFKNVPSRRADFIKITGSNLFPKKFCAIRWVENATVAKRAIEILPAVQLYVKEIEQLKKDLKSHPKPKTTINVPQCNSYQTVKDCIQDKLIGCKLVFFQSMASFVEPFLTEFQGNNPLTPFLYSSLHLLIQNLLQRFVKTNILNSPKPFSIYKIDLDDKQNLMKVEDVDIGFATKAAFKKCTNVSNKDFHLFRTQCLVFMKSIVIKLLEKSPLAYSFTRSMSCLDPQILASNEALANTRLSSALTHLTGLNRISGDKADAILREYKSLISQNVVKQKIKEFNKEERLDHFWVKLIDSRSGYANLLSFIKLICILFHGNASLERGFSVNSACLVENLMQDSLVGQRVVYDAITEAGGIKEVLIQKKMIHSFRNSSVRCKEALKEKQILHEAKRSEKKRKIENEKKVRELQAKKIKILENAQKEVDSIDNEVQSLKK